MLVAYHHFFQPKLHIEQCHANGENCMNPLAFPNLFCHCCAASHAIPKFLMDGNTIRSYCTPYYSHLHLQYHSNSVLVTCIAWVPRSRVLRRQPETKVHILWVRRLAMHDWPDIVAKVRWWQYLSIGTMTQLSQRVNLALLQQPVLLRSSEFNDRWTQVYLDASDQ